MKHTIKIIAFDADDTLWVNEPYFQETERKFCQLLEDFMPHHSIGQELFRTEMKNLNLYGYGVKAFMLSMIETALEVTNHRVNPKIIEKTIQYGKDLLDKPIELLEDVELVLKTFYGHYKLVVATKGDLLDQERKLMKSGLANYFHHIEIMSDKKEKDYLKLLKHLDCQPENFLMIGNSLKSDVLPVLEIGGYAVHIPYHTTWAHEVINHEIDHHNFLKIKYLREIINILN